MFELNEYTSFAKAAKKVFKKIDESLPNLEKPIQAFIDGLLAHKDKLSLPLQTNYGRLPTKAHREPLGSLWIRF